VTCFIACSNRKSTGYKDKEQIAKSCDSIMQLFSVGKLKDAMEMLKQNSAIAPENIDSLRITVNKQVDDVFPSYGNMNSYSFILEKRVKDFLVKRFYVLRFDKYYLKFAFTIYNTPIGWTITSFKYEEDLNDVLR
jgi:hypothetical protein